GQAWPAEEGEGPRAEEARRRWLTGAPERPARGLPFTWPLVHPEKATRAVSTAARLGGAAGGFPGQFSRINGTEFLTVQTREGRPRLIASAYFATRWRSAAFSEASLRRASSCSLALARLRTFATTWAARSGASLSRSRAWAIVSLPARKNRARS